MTGTTATGNDVTASHDFTFDFVDPCQDSITLKTSPFNDASYVLRDESPIV